MCLELETVLELLDHRLPRGVVLLQRDQELDHVDAVRGPTLWANADSGDSLEPNDLEHSGDAPASVLQHDPALDPSREPQDRSDAAGVEEGKVAQVKDRLPLAVEISQRLVEALDRPHVQFPDEVQDTVRVLPDRELCHLMPPEQCDLYEEPRRRFGSVNRPEIGV